LVKTKDLVKVERKEVVKKEFKTHFQEKNGMTSKPQFHSQQEASEKHVSPKPLEQKSQPNNSKIESLNPHSLTWKINLKCNNMLGEKSNLSLMTLNLKIVELHSMEWILPEINYVAWSENGKLWLKLSVTVNPLTDILSEYLPLLSQKETNNKKKKLVMLNILKSKKSEEKLLTY